MRPSFAFVLACASLFAGLPQVVTGCPLSGGGSYGGSGSYRSSARYYHHVYYLCDADEDGEYQWEVYRGHDGKPRCFASRKAAEKIATRIEEEHGYETQIECKYYAY